MPPTLPSEAIRRRVVDHVRGFFNEDGQGEPPSDDALFERDTPIRMVHADIVGMMVGGIRGLLLQMLHPHALQGVLDHSDFRADMHGRLRRTARFIATTSFGQGDRAEAAIARVNRIHEVVKGTLPDGTPYSARDPRTLAWVHVAEADSFLAGYLAYAKPAWPMAKQDEYFRQFAGVARRLGADPVPETRREADALLRDFRPELKATPEAREVARLVLSQRPEGTPRAVQRAVGQAAVDLLPAYARQMLGLKSGGLAVLPARAMTRGIAGGLRWAFRQG